MLTKYYILLFVIVKSVLYIEVNIKVKSGNVIDAYIHNEIIKLKIRINYLEALLNTRLRIIENGIDELIKTIIEKL